jgi:hypothetical protein
VRRTGPFLQQRCRVAGERDEVEDRVEAVGVALPCDRVGSELRSHVREPSLSPGCGVVGYYRYSMVEERSIVSAASANSLSTLRAVGFLLAVVCRREIS